MVSDVGNSKSHLFTACMACIISVILCLTLHFYSEWFISSQVTIMFGGFLGSWLFILTLTLLSNIEMFILGNQFSAKFIPEILFCLILSVVAVGMVHRVCATTCILFSFLGLYFIDRISELHYNKLILQTESAHIRKSGNKKK